MVQATAEVMNQNTKIFNKDKRKPEQTIRIKPLISIKSHISPLKPKKLFTTRNKPSTPSLNQPTVTPNSIQNKF